MYRDYAESYYRVTGKTLLDLIQEGLTDGEIQKKFKEVGLRRPGLKYLERYRKTVGDPQAMAEKIGGDFREWIRSRYGNLFIDSNVVLQSIILVGFHQLGVNEKVSVTELLKAIELKSKIDGGLVSGDIEKQIEAIFKGKKFEANEKEGVETKDSDGDIRPDSQS